MVPTAASGRVDEEGWLQAFHVETHAYLSVVVWQLRRLNIGTALVLVKVEEEDLELTALLTHSKALSVVPVRAPREQRRNRNPCTVSHNSLHRISAGLKCNKSFLVRGIRSNVSCCFLDK